MRKIRYRVTDAFGEACEGDVVDAYILVSDRDSSVSLVYHPKTSRYTCASLEFCVERRDGIWESVNQNQIRGGDYIGYVNIGSQKDLRKLAANVSALKYRRKKTGKVK